MADVPDEPLIYGVWVRSEGWLKVRETAVFADHRRPVAEAAASFIPGARVVVIDELAMAQMEKRFLTEEYKVSQRTTQARLRAQRVRFRQAWARLSGRLRKLAPRAGGTTKAV